MTAPGLSCGRWSLSVRMCDLFPWPGLEPESTALREPGPPGQVPSAPKSVLRSQVILPKAAFSNREWGRAEKRERAFYFSSRARFSAYLWLKRNFPKRNQNSSHRVSNDENQAQMVWTENIKSDAVTMDKWDEILAFIFFFLTLFKISLCKKSCCFEISFPLLH